MQHQQSSTKSNLPQWVQDQQHQSWQIEILIATGLIFFLSRIPDYAGEWFLSYSQASDIGPESMILLIGSLIFSRVLLMGFIINLMFRALWLAYLGINFVYPKDINYEKLQYSDFFRQKMEQKPDSVSRILRLEHYSSLSYSMTLMLTIMAFGVFLLLSVFFYGMKFISSALYDSQDFGFVVMVLFFLLSLGAFDYLFFRFFRNSPKVSRWYYPFYQFYSWVSLSFLFKREWLVLISNGKRWVIFSIFFVFFLISFFMTTSDLNRHIGGFNNLSFQLYEDRAYLNIPTYNNIPSQRYHNLLDPDKKIQSYCINEDVVKGESMWIFVVYKKAMDFTLEKIFKDYPIQKFNLRSREEVFANDTNFNLALSRYFNVYIDTLLMENLKWYYHKHPLTNEQGFKSYFKVDSIPPGDHLIHLNMLRSGRDSLFYRPYGTIPFFKE